jgi:hypothetical protein
LPVAVEVVVARQFQLAPTKQAELVRAVYFMFRLNQFLVINLSQLAVEARLGALLVPEAQEAIAYLVQVQQLVEGKVQTVVTVALVATVVQAVVAVHLMV